MPTLENHYAHFKTLNAQRIPRVMPVVGWIIVLGTALAAVFLATTPWIQTATGAGTVTALNPNDRLQEINALVPGRIQEWYVHDGKRVKAGDPIVRLVDNDAQLLDRLQAERAQVVAKLRAAESASRTAEIDLKRTRGLFDDGLAARRDYEQSRIKVEELRAKVAEAAAELSRVDVNLSRQSVQIVTAPRDGVILEANAGYAATFIKAGDVLATFVPDNIERVVELYIDGRDVGLVQPGAKVRLMFEGWPAVQFSGWPSVAIGTFAAKVMAVDPSAQASGRFRVLVQQDTADGEGWPEERFVRFGAKARGWILLGETSAGYELWRQLNNFPPNLPEKQASQ
ncbi:MAG TPA: RND transporter [Xanthomonadaceae bacterium]|jgi:RND family efflux transporter MFP subunit|nr:RND transporter [Xanthomonadaceae bacterium]